MQNLNINAIGLARRLTMALLVLAVVFVFSVARSQAQGNNNSNTRNFMSAPIGMLPGQTARVGVINPMFSDGSVRFMRGGHVKVFDGSGELLMHIPLEPVAPGEFHHVDISRSRLNRSGDALTGRLQVRIEFTLTFNGQTTTPGEVFPPSFELINEEGGQTILIGLLLPAVLRVR